MYRQKERIFWNLRLAEQTGQPRKLWQSIAMLMGLDKKKGSVKDCPTAEQLLNNFSEKIVSVRRSTGGYPAQSSLVPPTATLDEFNECSEDIKTIIMSRHSKSCELDPLSTNIMKEFLREILPFMVDMCNASL